MCKFAMRLALPAVVPWTLIVEPAPPMASNLEEPIVVTVLRPRSL